MFPKIMRPIALFVALSVIGLAGCSDSTSPGEPPSAPTNVVVTVSATTIVVTWTAGSGATSHRVVVSTTGEADRTMTVASGASEATFDDLTEGATYAVVVTAVNTDGEAPAAPSLAIIPENVVLVRDDVLSSTTWTKDKTYVLRGPIFVGKDTEKAGGVAATLTIEPGTTILGDVNPPQGARGSYLVVSRGSKLIADANANRADKSARPNAADMIVFTSSAPRGQRARGDWGGLVLNGRAPTNAGLEAEGEGESGLYGGTDPMDNSGIIRGVRIEFAGDRVTSTDELNGLAPQGVGAGTTIDYVQVAYNVDDGTEPFGGAPTMTHIVFSGIGDDSADGTDGWKGFMQFVIAQQRADEADQGFELSTNADNGDASPHSTGVIANATMVGAGVDLGTGEISALGSNSDWGVVLREGSNHRLFNNILTGFGESGFCVEGGDTAAHADNRLAGSFDVDTTLRFENNIVFDNVNPADPSTNFNACDVGYTKAENQTFFNAFNNMVVDPMLPNTAFSIGSMSNPPNFIATGIPAGYSTFDVSTLNGGDGLVMPTDGRVLVQTDYPGAVEPGTALADAWYYGWTMWSTNGSDSRPNQDGN